MHRKYFLEQTELGASLRVGMNGQSFPPLPRCIRCWDWDCCSQTTPCRALGPPLCSRWTQAPPGEIPGVRPECLRILLADQHRVWYSGQGPRNLVKNKTLSNTGKPCGSNFFSFRVNIIWIHASCEFITYQNSTKFENHWRRIKALKNININPKIKYGICTMVLLIFGVLLYPS